MGNLKCLSSAVVAAAMILTGPPARAALSDVTLAPLFFPVGSAELRLEAQATGALFGPHQPGWGGAQASGAILFMPQLRRALRT